MIIVRFCSGIGNQLYQYAIYLLMKEKYPKVEIKADLSAFRNDKILNKGNGFSYGFGIHDFFGVDVDVASDEEIKSCFYGMYFDDWAIKIFPKLVSKLNGTTRVARLRAKLFPKYKDLEKIYYQNSPVESYNGNILFLEKNENYYLGGLWQNYQYIEKIEKTIRENLKIHVNLPDILSKLAKEMKEFNSVCIHVRRGNFTLPENRYKHDICGRDYYYEAYNRIMQSVEKPVFYIFSDDIGYCKDEFDFIENAVYVSAIKGITTEQEMFLIGQCNNAVIPNSTFAFWSVWLNYDAEKIVICPKYFLREKNSWHEFSVPKEWTKIDNLS